MKYSKKQFRAIYYKGYKSILLCFDKLHKTAMPFPGQASDGGNNAIQALNESDL